MRNRSNFYARLFHYVEPTLVCSYLQNLVPNKAFWEWDGFLLWTLPEALMRLGEVFSSVAVRFLLCTSTDNYPCSLKRSFCSAYTRKNWKFFFEPSKDPIPRPCDASASSQQTKQCVEMERQAAVSGYSWSRGEELCGRSGLGLRVS